jgi:hypothetical protein
MFSYFEFECMQKGKASTSKSRISECDEWNHAYACVLKH